jgi:carbon starvation protein CstA
MSKKAGVELSTTTIIILILAILVLVIVILIATGAFGSFGKEIVAKIKFALGLWNQGVKDLPK